MTHRSLVNVRQEEISIREARQWRSTLSYGKSPGNPTPASWSITEIFKFPRGSWPNPPNGATICWPSLHRQRSPRTSSRCGTRSTPASPIPARRDAALLPALQQLRPCCPTATRRYLRVLGVGVLPWLCGELLMGRIESPSSARPGPPADHVRAASGASYDAEAYQDARMQGLCDDGAEEVATRGVRRAPDEASRSFGRSTPSG